MITNTPSSMPDSHREFLSLALEVLETDSRIVGVAAGGSYVANTMDEFSDLDLVIVTEPDAQASLMMDRQRLADTLGPLLVAFTGEHVGEPRLLICLYGPPLLHVDLKFVALADFAQRVEDPVVLWQRESRLTQGLATGAARFPAPDRQWIEDRFWTWMHYGAGKIGRGEMFEALEFLSFLRMNVLGPLGLQQAGARPAGVRRIEMLAPQFAVELQKTISTYDAGDCARALHACADLYRALRANAEGIEFRQQAETAAMDYLQDIARRC